MKGQKIKITPEMDLSTEWYSEAKKQTISTLPYFIRNIIVDYTHNDNSKVWAMTACAIGAAYAFNKSSQGNINTGMAGLVMWEFICEWTGTKNLCGFRIMDFSDMLYPGNQRSFEKLISRHNYDALKELAKVKLEGAEKDIAEYEQKLKKYDLELSLFINKHIDYNERPEYYTKNVTGTVEKIAIDEKRAREGFKFAPVRPQAPEMNETIINHWKSIINGHVPFGYEVFGDEPLPEGTELKVVKDSETKNQ